MAKRPPSSPTDKAADLLQGAEGSTVQLTRANRRRATPRKIGVRREQVEVPSVDNAKILDRPAASATSSCRLPKDDGADLDRALWKLHRARDEEPDHRPPRQSGRIADGERRSGRPVPRSGARSSRPAAATRKRTSPTPPIGRARGRVPLVVLIDGDSASASEIFAGAMRDHRRGTIVGVRSYGKGSVQGIFPLNIGNTGIRLTTAKFYSPAGKPYSKVGVEPTIEVRQAAKPLLPEPLVASPANGIAIAPRQPAVLATPAEQQPESTDDPVLAAALQVTRKNVAAR